MKVTLINVRAHPKSEFIFPENSLCLVKGKSGAGKTTIFQAMSWCLYKNVKEISEIDKGKTIVTLEFFGLGMRITRQRNPGLLTIVMADSSLYEDVEAQNIIYRVFGQCESWQCSSFMSQGNRCLLTSASNAAKMEILNMMSFNNEDPNIYITKIDEKIVQRTGESRDANTRFTENCKELQRQMNESNINTAIYVVPEGREAFLVEYRTLEISKKELENKIIEYQQMKGRQQALLSRQNDLSQKLTKLSLIEKDESLLETNEKRVEELNSQIRDLRQLESGLRQFESALQQIRANVGQSKNNYNNQQAQLNNIHNNREKYQVQIDKLDEEITKLEKQIIPIDKPIIETDVAIAESAERAYNQAVALAGQLGCSYDRESIATETNRINKILEQQPSIETLRQISSIRSILYPSSPDLLAANERAMLITNEQVIKAQQLITEIERSLAILQCPHCQKGLRIQGNRIIPEHGILHSPNELQKANSEFVELSQNYQKGLQLKTLKTQLASLVKCLGITEDLDRIFPGPNFGSEHPLISALNNLAVNKIFSPAEIQAMKIRLSMLQKIPILEKGTVDIPNLRLIVQKGKLLTEKSTLENQRGKLDEIISHQLESVNNAQKTATEWETKCQEFINSNTNNSENLRKELGNRNVSQLENEVRELNRINSTIRQFKSEKIVLDEEFRKVTIELAGLTLDETLSTQLSKLYQRMKEIEFLINNAISYDRIRERQSVLENDQKNLLRMQQRLAIYHTLKKMAIETEYSVIETTIANINLAIENIAQYIFEEPVTILLQTHKEIQSTKQSKPIINMRILIKEKEYDSITKLSFGTADRVSMAMMLALSKLSNCPFIIFDETLAHIHSSLKDACIKTIRKELPHKIAICVQHDSTEGFYDHVIRVGEEY